VRFVSSGIAAACVAVVAWAGAAASREVVVGRVEPISGIAPHDVSIEAEIEPDAANRAVTFTAESETFYTSSTFLLDGDQAPRLKRVTFRMLPVGRYTVRISVTGTAGERAHVSRSIELY
jgi:hypothetical protein